MKKTLNEALLECVGTNIEKLINDGKNSYVAKVLLNAYNTYQEDERFGVDYIFNINNNEDTACCFRGGMTNAEFVGLLIGKEMGVYSGYFYFGENYPKPKPLTKKELVEQLVNNIEEFLPYVMTYPQRGGYEEFYNSFVAPIWA